MSSPLVKCKNIKSRHYNNIQCSNRATHGDYCSKHWKKPRPYESITVNLTHVETIKRAWRSYCSKRYFKTQGPARGCLEISCNSTEVYSLEDLTHIPKIYIYSFADSNRSVWTFDIRTLSFLLSTSKVLLNPYTRDVLPQTVIDSIRARLQWLKVHKYNVIYNETAEFSSAQLWNQKVLDVFTKIERLGYIVNADWFHQMDKDDHIAFYKNMFQLWNIRLHLTHAEKKMIIPGYQSKNKLFVLSLSDLVLKDLNVLRKNNLQLIDRFISSVQEKTKQSLGVIYVLMGLSYVCSDIGEAYPWILESVS